MVKTGVNDLCGDRGLVRCIDHVFGKRAALLPYGIRCMHGCSCCQRVVRLPRRVRCWRRRRRWRDWAHAPLGLCCRQSKHHYTLCGRSAQGDGPAQTAASIHSLEEIRLIQVPTPCPAMHVYQGKTAYHQGRALFHKCCSLAWRAPPVALALAAVHPLQHLCT